MKSKEILDKNAKEILRRILMGESLTVLQNEYKVEKGTITDYYRKIFESDSKALEMFDKVLENTKKKTSSVNIEEEKLDEVVKEYLQDSITLKEAGKKLNVHSQTFKKLMLKKIGEDEELTNLYKKKVQKRASYKDFDFKKAIVQMLDSRVTQAEIEELFELKPKTLSKKISALRNTEDDKLYQACKMLSDSTMNKRELTFHENSFIDDVVNEYKEKEKENQSNSNNTKKDDKTDNER